MSCAVRKFNVDFERVGGKDRAELRQIDRCGSNLARLLLANQSNEPAGCKFGIRPNISTDNLIAPASSIRR